MADKIKKGDSLEDIIMHIRVRILDREVLKIEKLPEIYEPRRCGYVAAVEGLKCYPRISAEDLLGVEMKNMKNKFRKPDFQSFPQGWKVCDKNNVRPYLEYLHEAMGGNIVAALISKDVNDLSYANSNQLEDITNENLILKWGCMMRDAKKLGMYELTNNRNHKLDCSVGDDKSCPRKVFMAREHVQCQPCEWTEALMKSVDAEAKSSLKISDFPRLHEEYKKSDDTSVPAFLDYVEKGIGRDIAAGSIFGDDILDLARALFYAAIDEMHRMKLEGINEDVMRKWGCVFRDCKKMDLDVEFAEEHLKKIAHAYFVSLLEEEEEELLELNVVCSMSDTECFDDGVPLSKGILSSAPMEPTRAPI